MLDGAEEMEHGWNIHRRVWAQGVGTEAAAAAHDLAFELVYVVRSG